MDKEEEEIAEAIENMSEEEITKIQERIRKIKGAKYKRRGVDLRGYLPLKYSKHLDIVMSWLVDYGAISEKTIYKFTSYAAEQVIETVLKTLREKSKMLGIPPNK